MRVFFRKVKWFQKLKVIDQQSLSLNSSVFKATSENVKNMSFYLKKIKFIMWLVGGQLCIFENNEQTSIFVCIFV